jgi:hypothetical protein
MPIAPWIKPVRHAVCAATLSLAVAGTIGQAARAQQPTDNELEDHILNTDKRMIDGLLGAIGITSSAPDIDYRERSPLVVPQGRDLPPPGKAAKGSDWPLDADVKARRRQATSDYYSPPGKGQYDASRTISGTREARKVGVATDNWLEETKKKEPDFLSMLMAGRLGGTWEEYSKFDGEPPRTSLVQPPAGYLTPSPAAPYGTTDRKIGAEWSKEKRDRNESNH